MLKNLALIMLTFTIISSLSTQKTYAAENTINSAPSYSTVTEVEDLGPYVTKLIINLGENKIVNQGAITKNTFKVDVVRYQDNGTNRIQIHDPSDVNYQTPNKMIPVQGGIRNITNAYVSDKNGNSVEKSNFITLELQINPDDNLSSAIYAKKSYVSEWSVNKYTITQQENINTRSGILSDMTITNSTGGVKKGIEDFKTGNYTNDKDKITLTYADYTPAKDEKKNPLIIWLHGMGEGGEDPTIPISGNKACNFASKEIQSYFDGAYVLAPQCPTFWMEGVKNEETGANGFGDGTSKYEDTLIDFINNYISNNEDIDTDRIYIGGDSNGGYMTMLMLRDYGNTFAAAMPTCEALKDSLITDEDIMKIKDIPIWFTASKTDTTVPVDDYVKPTYDRLINAGAKNVHLSLFDKLIDTTGKYQKEDGSPYEFLGHFSWIKVYNNECNDYIDGKLTSIMEWLSSQNKASH